MTTDEVQKWKNRKNQKGSMSKTYNFKRLLSSEWNEIWNRKCTEINSFLGGIW